MGTNYLGHFALTRRLGDRIEDRIVSVTSMNYRFSRLDPDDLNLHNRDYSKWAAYGQSKLAMMLFTDELARRASAPSRPIPRRRTAALPRDSTGYIGWSYRNQLMRNFPQSARTAARSSIPRGDDGTCRVGRIWCSRFCNSGSRG